jgi:chromosome segregation ATPase
MLRELKEGYEDLAGESDYWEEMYGGHVDECEDLLRDCGDGVQACDALAEWVRLLEESASEKGRECKVLADQCTDEQEYDALLSAYQALEKAYEGMHHQYLTGQRLLRRHQSSLRRWQDDAEDLEEELEEWC